MEEKYYELEDLIDTLKIATKDCNDKYYKKQIEDIIDEIQQELDELEEEMEKEQEQFNKQQNREYWNSQF